jgi:hypothetical protein
MKPFKTHSKTLTWLTASLFALFIAGCGGGGGDDPAPAAGSGTLGVSLTDSPACGYDEVNVTVSKVRVHQSSSAAESAAGWTDIELSPARKINLLDLTNGAFVSLGETPLTAGHYTQVRLVLDPNTGDGLVNSVLPTGGAETPLITPSAVQSGIKLVNQFDVAADERVDLMLDFDACKSVVKRGNGTYALKPVVKVIPFVLNGISGFVDTAVLTAGVLVTAQQDGVIVQTTAPNATTGAFFLGRLEPGDYDVALTANDHATAVIASVPVATSTSVVDLSTASAPITLPASATHKVSGTAALNPASTSAVAYVTAQQKFGAAPVVTVKFVAADDTTVPVGAYELTLPSEAPLLGSYSTTLPIALAAQAGAAGLYTLEASAEGYTTQSADKNIAAADATQDFILVP